MSGLSNGNYYKVHSAGDAARIGTDPLGLFLPAPQQPNPVSMPGAPAVPENTAQANADDAMQALRVQSNGGRASTTLTAANGTLADQDRSASSTLLE